MISDKPQPQSGAQEPEEAYPETTSPDPALPVQNTSRRKPDASDQHTHNTSRDQQRPRRRINNLYAPNCANEPDGPPVFGLLKKLPPGVLDTDPGLLKAMVTSIPSINTCGFLSSVDSQAVQAMGNPANFKQVNYDSTAEGSSA
eukprot:3853923-Pleurochrysis_carterae.AAC.2